jgi:hypothetical protein
LTVARWLLFGVSAVAVISAAERLSRRATAAGDLRLIATSALAAAIAVGETLLLGTVGLGGNGVVIAAAALVTGVVVRLGVPARGVSTATLARDGWQRLTRPGRALVGGVAGAIVAQTIYLIGRPGIGTDGLIYHLADPAIWVTDGHPGSMRPTVSGLPVQAYPKTGEVLFGWAIGTARTPVATTLLVIAAAVVAAVAAWSVLRRLGVQQWVAVTLTVALLGCPVPITQLSGPNTDLLTLTWVLCTGALCIGAVAEPPLVAVALVAGGVAVGTKTTAIPIVVVVLAVTAWWVRRTLARHWLIVTLAAATTVGVGVVWYIQDFVVYRAPFYPFSRIPDGPPLPPVITALGARFISDPAAAIRTATAEHYLRGLGGGAVLALGVVVAVLLLPTVRDRRLRRAIALAATAAVLETLVWSAAPFTGAPDHGAAAALVLSGIRYLLPGVALYTVTVGLASRAKGLLGPLARLVAVGAVAANIWADRSFQAGFRPHLVALVAAALLGAVAVELVGAVRAWPVATGWLVAAGLAVVAVAGLTAGTRGYLGRHIAVARELHIGAPQILARLERQPRWSGGHLPVAIGPLANAMLAGPTFNHPLSVISETTRCSVVIRDHAEGWVVLPTHPIALAAPQAHKYDRSECLAGTAPSFSIGGVAVYGPGQHSATG